MANGKIVQKGNLNKLRSQKGVFIKLWEKYIKEQSDKKSGKIRM